MFVFVNCHKESLEDQEYVDGKPNYGLILKEHESAKWLTREELDAVDWLTADITLIKEMKKRL